MTGHFPEAGSSGQATLRRATVDDAQTLSALAARTFTETFGHLYPPEDLRDFLDGNLSTPHQRELLADPDAVVWLAEEDGQVIGHVCAARYARLPHPDIQPGDGEIKRLYLRGPYQNGGRGRRLMDAAMAWLLADGPRTLWVSVWSENPGAQRFYARYGFEHLSEYEFVVGRCRDREFIWRRKATA